MRVDRAGLWVLTETESRALLAGAGIGRVVVSMKALPAALPVNYQLIGREIYFRTAAGTKLAAAVNQTVVAFEVDDFNAGGSSGWSVLVVGTARLVTDPAERALLDAAGINSWGATGGAHYVAIGIDRITGRRLWPPHAAAGGLLDTAASSGGSAR